MFTSRLFSKLTDQINDPQILDEIQARFKKVNKSSFRSVAFSESQIEKEDPIVASIAKIESETLSTEAIILLLARPALLIQNDEFEQPEMQVWQERLNPLKSKLKKIIRAVGRIEIKNHPSYDWLGTGWIAEGGILVTNRHVAEHFGRKRGESFVFKPNHLGNSMKVSIDFKEEYQIDKENEISVSKILYIAPYNRPDVALLQLDVELPGIKIQDGVEDNSFIATIGYPAYDYRNDHRVMGSIFKNIYNVKRLQPGMKNAQVNNNIFFHDCSTLGGNSGSPIIDLLSLKACGLHYGGKYQQSNYAVDGRHLKELIGNLG